MTHLCLGFPILTLSSHCVLPNSSYYEAHFEFILSPEKQKRHPREVAFLSQDPHPWTFPPFILLVIVTVMSATSLCGPHASLGGSMLHLPYKECLVNFQSVFLMCYIL